LDDSEFKDEVVKVDRQKLRAEYESSRRPSLAEHAALVGDEMQFRINQLYKLIGTNHYQSVGKYQERLLRDTISKFLPRRYTVSSGFVAFPKSAPTVPNGAKHDDRTLAHRMALMNRMDHDVSKQLDVIVWDSSNYPAVFQDLDEAVVRPESVFAVGEVKGALKRSDIKSTIESYVDFGEKWSRMAGLLNQPLRVAPPVMFLLAWDTYVDKKGCKIEPAGVREAIVEEYGKHEIHEHVVYAGFPVLEGLERARSRNVNVPLDDQNRLSSGRTD